MAWKRFNPCDPCCDPACDDLCFVVRWCEELAEGVTIEVFVTGSPGTIIASGDTDVTGSICFDLSSYSGSSLSYNVIPPDETDFTRQTAVLVGNWCGRTVQVALVPATIDDEQKKCCSACTPDTIPQSLTLTDDCGCSVSSPSVGFLGTCGDCSEASAEMVWGRRLTNDALGSRFTGGEGWGIAFSWDWSTNDCVHSAPLGPVVPIANYGLYCIDGEVRLAYAIVMECAVVGDYGASACRFHGGAYGTVVADSVTCDPFAATFTVPGFTLTGFIGTFPFVTPCGTREVPARTITITQ